MAKAAERQKRAHHPLLERESELRTLHRGLDDLCGTSVSRSGTRSGGVLAFGGPAGVGKTTLLAEARRRAGERGCAVFSARGGEQEQQVAFHVVRQLVQPVLAILSEHERRQILGQWYGIVAPAIGLVAPRDGAAPDPQGVRDGLDWVATRLSVHSGRPVVLILDDAHWADAESLAWLTAFAARAEELPMLVIVAYRPDELPSDALGLRTLAERHGARPHQLASLTPSAVARMLRGELGDDADDPFCRECWAVTGGNPFEVVELAAKIRERDIKPHQDNVPELRELAYSVKGSGLIERLERLGPSAVRLAWAAAVLGTGVPSEVVGSVAALGDEQAADAIDRLQAARILTVASDGRADGTVEFFHPVIATAVYRSIRSGTRVAIHGVAARAVLEAGHGAGAAARHMLEMHPEGDPWVVEQLRQAARETLQAGAPEAARRYLARALREPPEPRDRAAVLFELGCASLLHDPVTTVNHLRAALEEPETEPSLHEAVVYRLAQALAHTGRIEEAASILDEEARRATSARTRLRMQAEQFKWSSVRADEEDSSARSRLLARFADRLTGRGLAERHILGLRAWSAVMRGEPVTTALHHAEKALDGGLSWTDADFGFEVPAVVALTFMYCDQPGRAEDLFNQGIAEFEEKGWRGAHLSFAYTLLGYIRYRRGRFVEAEDFVRSGLQIADRLGHGLTAQSYGVSILIEILIARGRVDQAQAVARAYEFGRAFPKAVVYPDPQTVYGRLLLARGLARQAEKHLAAAGQRLDRRGTRNPAWCSWQIELAAAQAVSRPQQARATAAEAVARARAFGTPSAIGQALRAAASVAEASQATALLAEAVRYLEQSPSAYEMARALVDHGSALCSSGNPEVAADHLYRGMETAATCGAEALVARAQSELSAAGLRPRRLRATEQDTLTTTEARVARHAALGLDNEAIAAELSTDERDVSRLLSTVFTKIGTDRTGLRRALGL